MLKIRFYISIVLLFTGAYGSINNYERANNKILLQVLENIKKNKNHAEIKVLEKTYLLNIERDILYQFHHMPHNLKKLLGDFKKSFYALKNKVSLIHDLVRDVSNHDIQQEDFLFTILGLKPVSIVPKSNLESWDHKAYGIVNKHYPHTLSRGEFIEKMPEGSANPDPSKSEFIEWEYIVCDNFIFPFRFIKSCYPDIRESPTFIDEFYAIKQSHNQSKMQNFIEKCWKSRNEDDTALMLGYVPTWFAKNVWFIDKYKCLMDPKHSHNFRVLVIPGAIDCLDESPYVLLYEKLLEYAWISLCGLEYYLENLERLITIMAFAGKKLTEEDFGHIKKLNNINKIIAQANI